MTIDDNDDVARLVRLADANASIDAERMTRVRTAVHDAWSDEYGVRHTRQMATGRRLVAGLLITAAAAVLIAVVLWRPTRTVAPVFTPVRVGQIEPAGGPVMSGSMVTTSRGTLAMTLASDVQLRLDSSSSVRADSASEVTLERGAVYVDSTDAHSIGADASPIGIRTPMGLIRDIGTQFEVRLADAGLRIRVRNGQVRVTYANGVDARASAGEEMLSKPDGSIERRHVALTGTQWAWAERAAPTFSVEGRTLGAFLDWVSREGAWTVTFADSTLAAPARATVLSGKQGLLKGLTPTEALDVVLPTCGLRYRIERQRVVIEKETSK